MQHLASLMTERFIAADAAAAAKALEMLATHEIILLLRPLKAHVVIPCFNVMDPAKAAAVLRRLPLKQTSYLLAHLEVVQAARLWKEFSAPYQERLRGELDTPFVQLLTDCGAWAQGRVGRLMQTDFVSVRTDAKVGELVEKLKTLPRKKLPAVCFVTAKDGSLKGSILAAELAFYPKDAVCGSVMTDTPFLHVTDTFQTAREQFSRTQTALLAVVNEQHILMGFVESTALPAEEKSLWNFLKK